MRLSPRDLAAIEANARRGGYVRPQQVLQLLADLAETREQIGHTQDQLRMAHAQTLAGAQRDSALTSVRGRLKELDDRLAAAAEATSTPRFKDLLEAQAKGVRQAIAYVDDEFHVEPDLSLTPSEGPST